MMMGYGTEFRSRNCRILFVVFLAGLLHRCFPIWLLRFALASLAKVIAVRAESKKHKTASCAILELFQ